MQDQHQIATAPSQAQGSPNWTEVIEPRGSLFQLRLRDVWNYRDLLTLLVRRDFVATYKQTILGPLWFFIQPLFTTITYTFIFGQVAGLSTDGVPKMLFYMAGITLWNYFAECLNKTSTVFRDNASVFGKVYFPRLVMPLSIVVSNLIKLGIQFALFLGFMVYFFLDGASIQLQWALLPLLPVLVLIVAAQGLGFGMIISSMTTKYRDLVFLLQFGVQLLMYATPVIYPLSSIPEQYQWIISLNPMTAMIEIFRHIFLGSGSLDMGLLLYSTLFSVGVMLLGTVIFNRVERDFMDTV